MNSQTSIPIAMHGTSAWCLIPLNSQMNSCQSMEISITTNVQVKFSRDQGQRKRGERSPQQRRHVHSKSHLPLMIISPMTLLLTPCLLTSKKIKNLISTYSPSFSANLRPAPLAIQTVILKQRNPATSAKHQPLSQSTQETSSATWIKLTQIGTQTRPILRYQYFHCQRTTPPQIRL